jgi:hypothetical protein
MRGQLGITHRVLDIAVAQIGLQLARANPQAGTLHHASKACRGEGQAALRRNSSTWIGWVNLGWDHIDADRRWEL